MKFRGEVHSASLHCEPSTSEIALDTGRLAHYIILPLHSFLDQVRCTRPEEARRKRKFVIGAETKDKRRKDRCWMERIGIA
jgi:hypothetical protein